MSEEILKLKKEIERLKKAVKKHRYGLVWMDVPEAFEDDVENKLPILKEVPKLAIKNKDNKQTHILIEGDNYHALSCLNYTHNEKIDVIYIDPPYNTGSDGFRYKDKRIIDKYPDGTDVPIEHPFRHSYWLSFMSKRLELSRDVLKDSGLIFISIDDNEFAQLKLLCDEIFEPNNFISVIALRVSPPNGVKTTHAKKTIIKEKEFLLVYAKNKDKVIFTPQFKRADKWDKHFNSFINKPSNDYKSWSVIPLTKKLEELGLEANLENIDFLEFISKNADNIFQPVGLAKIKNIEKYNKEKIVPIDGMIDYYAYKGRQVQLLSKSLKETPEGFTLSRLVCDLWTDISFNNLFQEGGVDLKFGKKPVELIKRIIKLSTQDKNSLILDFFAGSGTTGEAVMDLNNSDNGKRQFILVTNNDEVVNGKKHKIMSDLCYPRIKNVIRGYNNKKGLGNSIKYYKTAFIGKNNILNATDQDKIELAHNAGELLAIAENTLELIKQNTYYQLFEEENKGKYTAVYFREELDKFDEFTEMVKKLKKPTTIYVFSWGDEEFFDDFSDIDEVKVKTIPLPILEIYKQIYNLSTE